MAAISTDSWPLLLAGPMVRRASPHGVAIWLALSAPNRVGVELVDDRGAPVARGDGSTVAIGDHLHVAVIVARGRLTWGAHYRYRVWTGDDRKPVDLADVTYPGDELPGVTLPPTDLTRLRIAHGSCRLLHGEGDDALATLDAIIAGGERPHHLLLTGDQVYVNNIAPEILPHLTALGDALMGWAEPLPETDGTPADFPPGSRETLIRDRGGLLEYGDASHLIGLGEMVALYLMGWSDALWPDDSESFGDGRRGRGLRRFRATLPAARRALANVPVLMIFDDHEVTDDWNLTLHWCGSVLGKPLGRRIVSNALSAYAVFQAWGNTPVQFATGRGRKLLDRLASWRGDAATAGAIERLVGIPEVGDIVRRRPPRLVPPDGAVDWSYDYRGPGYQIVVPDQRNWRAFPSQRDTDRPALMSFEAIDRQVGQRLGDQELVILMSSSALLPTPKPWYARTLSWVAEHWTAWRRSRDWRYPDVYGPDRGDAWHRHSPAFERLLATLASRHRAGRVLALVGDIHIGSAARLVYHADRPYLDGPADRCDLVMAHFTCSPLRKEHAGTRMAHRVGYGLAGPPEPRTVLGWHQPPRIEQTMPSPFGGHLLPARLRDDPPRTELARPGSLLVSAPPDWSYRVDRIAAVDGAGPGSELVGVNQIGIVRLLRSERGWAAEQTVWWTGPGGEAAPRSRFRVSLEASDPDYPIPRPDPL